MRKIFVVLWTLIFIAAAYDAYFAWQLRDLFNTWEENPVARWVAANFGLGAFIVGKFLGLVFAASVATYCLCRRRPRLAWPLTVFVCLVYGFLSVQYVLISQPAFAAAPTQHSAR